MDYLEAENKLNEINRRHITVATEFADYCEKFAEHKFEYERLLSTRIMVYKAKKANIGIEMCVLTAMDDPEYTQRLEFVSRYKGYLYFKAMKEGTMERLEAIKSEKSTMQSLMKFQLENE